jgi:hypothetical protein
LIAKVAHMMGRKLEENDWTEVYCRAKGIPLAKWSNLHLDVIHNGLGIEQKMLKVTESQPIRELCGTRPMHPAQTRSIRISSQEKDPNVAMRSVFAQYAEYLEERQGTVRKRTGSPTAELRSGWLLYQSNLREFLYFEEPLVAPDPEKHYAEWNERTAGGARKASKNLWIYNADTKLKVWSVTTDAGAKIQPYFDVPAPDDPNLYTFVAQGFHLDGKVRVWVTTSTAAALKERLGGLELERVSEAIQAAEANPSPDGITVTVDSVVEVVITADAYELLGTKFAGVSDEHSFQLLVKSLSSKAS